ncbi:unnamed protein product [Lactuca saligna]|uniref:Uncharacterized protein n=1 Tax=Lactuca saligna TaxID=75948 RepID=A0AA35Z5P4_LACSI|nr:unnamed protein product [Lactuca saligna]
MLRPNDFTFLEASLVPKSINWCILCYGHKELYFQALEGTLSDKIQDLLAISVPCKRNKSTKASSRSDYSEETVKAFLETLNKEHTANLDKTNKVVDESANFCKETTQKVDKQISDARSFMSTFQNSFETNTAKANAMITSLGSTLRTEKDHIENVCTGIKTNNTEFHSSISSKIDKLHEDLAIKNKIMHKLPIKTKKNEGPIYLASTC